MNKFGLIGGRLGHSYSKQIHKLFGDYEYDYLETTKENLPDVLQNDDYRGFNITIPFKRDVFKMCDELSDIAMRIGSVNTIMKQNGCMKGDNTDYYGFQFLLKRNKIDIAGKKCMVLGSGGASVMVQAALKDLDAAEVVVISRTGENNYENWNRHFDAEIIVNTTPVGMYPDNGRSLVDLDDFPRCSGAVDLIYNPNKTKFVLDAMAKGIPACGGLSMLVAQAKQSSEIFQNQKIAEEEIESVLYEIRSAMMNKVLIGMPGAGKTYLGRKFAEREGRKFVDLDDRIVEHEGKSIPEIFAEDGEDYFRNVETEMLREACKQSGMIIACGGGIVKRKANYNLVKQNSQVIWVKRDLDKLETEGRPISESRSLEELYEERKDAYEFWSDYFIDNNQDTD